ncbi:Cto1p ASCRUDRAFT_26631, partial [Ascoidea rubescens DSM 1968]
LDMKPKFKITPKVIIIDWDETITKYDTIGLLGSIPYKNKILSCNLPPWSHFNNYYFQQFKSFNDSFNAKHKVTSTKDEIYYQKQLKSIDLLSINKIVKSKVFENVTDKQFKNLLDDIKIREGFWEFINSLIQNDNENLPNYKIARKIIILSVNWSKLPIQHAFIQNLGSENYHKYIKIITNEFEFQTVNTNELTGKINDSNELINVLIKIKNSLMLKTKEKDMMIYIGDSRTDLLSMLNCDIGFIMS